MIYFDNNATTPVLPEVREAMLPFFEDAFGNPSSAHALGTRSRVAVDDARKRLAALIGVMPTEIVFTGCGSEANNMAIVGTLLARFQNGQSSGKNLVISAVEHPAVRETAAWAAAKFGFELRLAPIRLAGGAVDPAPFLELIDADTVLVSVMTANNETGVLLPIAEVFRAAKAVGAVCHSDAVQGLGKVRVRPAESGADLLTFAAHKFHGPKGVGGLYVRRGTQIEPLIHGGPQESARRAGTENVAYVVGMVRAAELAAQQDLEAIRALRDGFEAGLRARFGDRVTINFADVARTPNASSVSFRGQDGNLLLIKLDRAGICTSTGAACSSGSLSPSKGLLAMGLSEKQAQSTLRFSFSKLNTEAEVDQCLDTLAGLLGPKA